LNFLGSSNGFKGEKIVKNKRVICAALILLFLTPLLFLNNFSLAQSNGDSWPMFHNNAAHTGTSNTLAPTNNQTLWKFNTGGQMGSPTVTNGIVYVCSYDDKIYAFNALNGDALWNYTTGSRVGVLPSR